MKKLTLFLLFTILCSLFTFNSSFGQWTGGGALLSYAKGDQHRPIVSATHEGGSFVTWVGTDSSSTGYYGNIFLNSLDNSGNISAGWSQHGISVTPDGNQWAPVIITSENDNVIIAWQGYLTPTSALKIFTQKYSNAGTPLWNGGYPVPITANTTIMDQYPIIVSDKHNGLYATWYRFDTTGITNIYIEHIDSTGNIDKAWNPNGAVVANTAAREYYPRIVLSNDGTALYIMYTSGPIGASEILLKKFNTSDGSQFISNYWTANGIVLSPGPYVYPTVVDEQFLFCDNQDNVVAFWSETRYTANGEIYMQRVSPAGMVLLSGGGIYLTGKNNGYGTMHLVASKDADGNFLLADNDYSKNSNVEALKVSANGKIIWRNITVNGTSEYPKPVSNGHGGMYVFYKNSAFTPPKLQALAIDSLGNFYKTWNITGADFGNCDQYDMFFPQYDFFAAATLPGRAIVSWNRHDNLQYNVYICNLKHDGTDCDADHTSINELANNNTLEVFPNPFTSEFSVQSSVTGVLNLELYDITGKLILAKSLLILNYPLSIVHYYPMVFISTTLPTPKPHLKEEN